MTDVARRRGDTYPIIINVTQDGEPLDVTGATFLLTVDPDPDPVDDLNNVFQLTGSVVDGPNGVVRFDVTATEMDNVGSFYYDVQMTLGGIITTVAYAKISWTQDITK